MIRKGIAKGNFRIDCCTHCDDRNTNIPNAPKARKRMMDKSKSLSEDSGNAKDSITDIVVRDFMGGSRASEYQANAYQKLIDDIKGGNGTNETPGSLSEASRKRMIERDEEQNHGCKKYPDIGKDKANRRAYPEECKKR